MPHELFLILSGLSAAEVEGEAGWMQKQIRAAMEANPSYDGPKLPDISELAISEYFQAAKEAALKELAPMMESGQS